ncbi:MAG: 50S ribosomal protein L22 [Endomicrobium sp.]|jgi:large subunit ribosomal protein L22|nr:50S ribosomal protein L22 [Endomicrobium sp.]
MEVKAIAKFVKCTPRKVNQVLALIRNKRVEKAIEILSFLPKTAALIAEKVLKSAVANAGKLKDYSDLKVKEAWVGSGSELKRVMICSKARKRIVRKKMAHITIVVTDADGRGKRNNKSDENKIKVQHK